MALSPSAALANARTVIEGRLLEQWVAAGYSPDAISWPGVNFTAPTNDAWLEVQIDYGANQRLTVGDARTHKSIGSLDLILRNPDGKGMADLLQMVGTLKDAFQGVTLSEVQFDTVSVNAPVSQNGWQVAAIVAEFNYYEFIQT